jgi:hypothetical protein
MALMGHSTGSRVHATYTHIELPVKREAIRKLEEWKIHQLQPSKDQLLPEQDNNDQQKKEMTDALTETDRSESGPSPGNRET